MPGKVYQINVKPDTPGEHGLPKRSVEHVVVTRLGLEGDFCRHRYEHGNAPERALLIYPLEEIRLLKLEGWPIEAGHIGENLTTEGIPYEQFGTQQQDGGKQKYVLVDGKRFRIGESVEIQIAKVCNPCSNLSLLPYVDRKFPEFFRRVVGKRGWYAKVLKDGEIKRGDPKNQGPL